MYTEAEARAVLGLSAESTDQEIRSAYRRLALAYHPDKNKSADANKRFQELKDAYDVLTSKSSTEPKPAAPAQSSTFFYYQRPTKEVTTYRDGWCINYGTSNTWTANVSHPVFTQGGGWNCIMVNSTKICIPVSSRDNYRHSLFVSLDPYISLCPQEWLSGSSFPAINFPKDVDAREAIVRLIGHDYSMPTVIVEELQRIVGPANIKRNIYK